eukprot:6186157-Prymnesium_polylepis.1
MKIEHGELAFRIQCGADASLSQALCVVQEWDLLPTWIKFAKKAAILRQDVSNELWLYADFNWWPMPMPAMWCLIRLRFQPCLPLPDERSAAEGDPEIVGAVQKELLVTVESDTTLDRSSVPADVQKHFEVPLRQCIWRLRPQPLGPAGHERTKFEGVAAVHLSDLTFLGPFRFMTPPAWFLKFIIQFMMPFVFRTFLALVRTLGDENSLFYPRVQADVTGIYRF